MSISTYKNHISSIEQLATILNETSANTCEMQVKRVTALGSALSAFDSWNGMAKFYYATNLDAKIIIAARTTYLKELNRIKYYCKDCSTPTINGLRPRRR
jgi:hypothetical protein